MRNPRAIVEQEAGYDYLLPLYEVTDEGVKYYSEHRLLFCRGDKSDALKPRQHGFFVESLIETCVRRLHTVNVGELATENTNDAIFHLDMAMQLLGKRSNDRLERQVEGTYQK